MLRILQLSGARLPVRPSTETCLICSKVGDSPPYEGTSIQEVALPDDSGVFTTLAAGGVAAGDSSLADFPPIRCEREMLLDESLIFRKKRPPPDGVGAAVVSAADVSAAGNGMTPEQAE